jgi:diguanylate cyclase (GGDEF)-like protein
MDNKILIISDKKTDFGLFEKILGSKGFDVELISLTGEIEKTILKNTYDAIISDFDFIGAKVFELATFLQENRSKSCFIVYGETIKTDKISEILQKGAYGFVPRELISERICDTVSGGLENRKAFVDILAMIDELRDVNEKLENEKKALESKNRELSFINRLTREVSYDLNWDRILPRILDAGLLNVIDPELFGILYRIGPKWNLAVYLSKEEINKGTLQQLKKDIVENFYRLSKEKIAIKEIALYLYPSNIKVSSSSPVSVSQSTVGGFLSSAGNPLGMLVILEKNKQSTNKGLEELASTISNILSMSLKNVQEYHSLKEMTVKDGLTGIYNYKGFSDFLGREFGRAKRYDKSLALIMIDVDNFKSINDSFGHLAGDYVLRELAYCLNASLRKTDIVARYGGDEFVILLPEAPLDKAEVLANRILCSVKNHVFEWKSENIKVEISYGISTILELNKEDTEEALVQMADSRLYDSRRSRTFLNAV